MCIFTHVSHMLNICSTCVVLNVFNTCGHFSCVFINFNNKMLALWLHADMRIATIIAEKVNNPFKLFIYFFLTSLSIIIDFFFFNKVHRDLTSQERSPAPRLFHCRCETKRFKKYTIKTFLDVNNSYLVFVKLLLNSNEFISVLSKLITYTCKIVLKNNIVNTYHRCTSSLSPFMCESITVSINEIFEFHLGFHFIA